MPEPRAPLSSDSDGEPMPETKDTPLGLLRRTGPASAEMFDPTTGKVYGFNFAAIADTFSQGPYGSTENGREWLDHMFKDDDE